MKSNLTGSAYAASVELDEGDVTCGEDWAVRVRAVNEMGEGPPQWYPTLVRTRSALMYYIVCLHKTNVANVHTFIKPANLRYPLYATSVSRNVSWASYTACSTKGSNRG